MYNQKVLEIFMNPKNAGGLHGANGVAKYEDTISGDVFKIYLKINRETEVIEEAKFKTMGCVASIVSSSIVTELVTNKTIEEVKSLSEKDIFDVVIDLPVEKNVFVGMAIRTLHLAIEDYYKRIEKEQKKLEKQNA